MTSEIFKNEDGNFIVFPNDAIAQHIKSGKLWEKHFRDTIDVFLEKGHTVVDIGANFGYNSVLMGRKIGPGGILIAFEPQRIIYQQLNGNLILNNIFNAITVQAALGSIQGKSTMSPVNYDSSWVNIGDTSIGYGGEEVDVYLLDQIQESKVDFIKLDAQGFELFVLQGAQKLLEQYKPDLFIEIEPHQLAKFQITENQLVEYIKSFVYSMYKINNEYPCDHICTVNNLHKIETLKTKLPLVQI